MQAEICDICKQVKHLSTLHRIVVNEAVNHETTKIIGRYLICDDCIETVFVAEGEK